MNKLEERNSEHASLPDIAGDSHIGKNRETNQDHYLIADLQRLLTIRSSNVPHDHCEHLCSSRAGHLLVVADGMGGHAAGEVASSTAIESAASYVLDMMHWFLKLSVENEDDFMEELADCLKVIQKRIWAKNSSEHDRMGTTVTMAYVLWPRMYLVHAGDSRCYLYRSGELRQLTTDHTLAQQMVDAGAMTPEDALESRWQHVLWNCVGGSDQAVQPEVSKLVLQKDDRVLLCSDGLTGMVADSEIAAALKANRSSSDTVSHLVTLANDAGGKDNITVVIGTSLETNVDDDSCVPVDLADTTLIEE